MLDVAGPDSRASIPWRCLLWASLCLLAPCSAKVHTAVVMPHGDFVYAPQLVDFKNGSAELHSAAQILGQELAGKFDTVFLTTPHGLELQQLPLIYLNPYISGVASLGGDVPNSTWTIEVPLQMEVDVELASLLRDELGVGTMGGLGVGRKGESQEKTASDGDSALIEGLLGFGGQGALPVNWGEIVPLSMLVQNVSRSRSSRADSSSQQGGRHGQEREHKIPKALVLSMPARRYNHSVEMIDDLLRLGGELYQILHSSSKDILWLVSSDLAHTHLADGPYGFCSCALAFDRAISAWVEPQGSNSEVRRERRRAALLQEAALQQMLGAKACGFTGLVLLQGAFDASFPTSSEAKRGRRLTGGGMRAKGEGGGADVKGAEWEGQLLANYHPTYYGMAVARFEKTRVGMHRDADGSGGGMSLDDTGDNRVA